MIVPYQIYRHFKGGLYLIVAVALAEENFEPNIVYMSLNGDNKVWTRSQTDFTSLVPEGRLNPTGQKYRFELVNNVSSVLSQCTTENLIKELKGRPDSPLNERNIEGFNDRVAMSEYVLGEIKSLGEDQGVYLETTMTADSLDEVKIFVANHPERCNSRMGIYKSVIVELESFD